MEKLNILIFGAGATGNYIGGSLVQTGQQVTFIEQPEVAGELAKRGLRLDLRNSKNKRHELEKLLILPSSAFKVANSLTDSLQQGHSDIAIFALKSFDTATALEGIKACADQLPPILCLSNRVDNEPELVQVLGEDKVIAGTVTSPIGRRGAGNILLEKLRGVGVADGHPVSLWLAFAMGEAGLDACLYPRAADMKWSKMLTNLMVIASVAILDMPPRDVLGHPGLFKLEITML